ncbi:MAG: MBL fold metallo-hydrolase [Clostridia bacterium]|nr:MBL fold metallo-hydrolase [Clostridia bacterium]
MKLKLFVSPDMGENCYFVIDENTKETIIIDPGAMADKLCSIVDKNEFNVKAICLTHAHFDHAGAAEALKEHTNAPVFICQGEEVVAESANYNLSAVFGSPFTVPYDRVLTDGEKFSFGGLTFKVISTPGHTPGGGCFYFENEGIVFSGDTLFMMSVGRTDFPGGDSETLIDSIRNKLFLLPADTTVYTGHGQSTSIGYEMENNGFVN